MTNNTETHPADGVAYWGAALVQAGGVAVITGSGFGVRVDPSDDWQWGAVYTTRAAAEAEAAGTRREAVRVMHRAGGDRGHWWVAGDSVPFAPGVEAEAPAPVDDFACCANGEHDAPEDLTGREFTRDGFPFRVTGPAAGVPGVWEARGPSGSVVVSADEIGQPFAPGDAEAEAEARYVKTSAIGNNTMRDSISIAAFIAGAEWARAQAEATPIADPLADIRAELAPEITKSIRSRRVAVALDAAEKRDTEAMTAHGWGRHLGFPVLGCVACTDAESELARRATVAARHESGELEPVHAGYARRAVVRLQRALEGAARAAQRKASS